MTSTTAGASLARRLAWIGGARLLFLTMLLLAVVLLYGRSPLDVSGFTVQGAAVTLAGAYALAALNATWLRGGKRLDLLTNLQLILDQLTWSVIVYLSGGAASGATSLYGLSCLAGATLTGFTGAGVAALSALVFYVTLVLALTFGWLPPPPDQPAALYTISPTEALYYMLVNVLVLIVVMLLGGYLAERLRLTGGELRRAEERVQRAERMALLGQVAAGLAHEIRNPLGSIAGSIQLLKTAPTLSAEDRQLCEIIQGEAARLNDLVADMMDLARPRRPEFVTVDVAMLAAEVVALAGRSGRAVSDVNVRYLGPESVLVRGDSGQVRQMLWNLIRNAVQASTAGDTVEVRIRLEGDSVVLGVADHGMGIDEDAKARLFDAFFTTRSKGTGVGLAVVKKIVDDHGYSIEVSSERGEGALFEVRMQHVPPPEVPAREGAPGADRA